MARGRVENAPLRICGSPEDVAYWFFRLNGCLTIRSFVIHPDRKGSQRTEIDVVAVRFTSRRELDMVDDVFFSDGAKPRLFLVEVKASGACVFNEPWTRTSDVIHDALERLGCYTPEELGAAAMGLHSTGRFTAGAVDADLVAVADREDPGLTPNGALQLPWEHVLRGLFDRLSRHRNQKRHAPQWDSAGRALFAIADRTHRDLTHFTEEVRASFFPGDDVDDPRGSAWGGYRWSEWIALDDTEGKCPSTVGLYRVRCRRGDGLLYVGAAFQATLRSRIGGLRRSVDAIGHRGHSAGRCVARCIGTGCRVEVSWLSCASDDKREILGKECDLIAAHRSAVGRSPQCQFKGLGAGVPASKPASPGG